MIISNAAWPFLIPNIFNIWGCYVFLEKLLYYTMKLKYFKDSSLISHRSHSSTLILIFYPLESTHYRIITCTSFMGSRRWRCHTGTILRLWWCNISQKEVFEWWKCYFHTLNILMVLIMFNFIKYQFIFWIMYFQIQLNLQQKFLKNIWSDYWM